MHLKLNWVTFEEDEQKEDKFIVKKPDLIWNKNLDELLNCGWYFRNQNGIYYDSEFSTNLLRGTETGTFLIRDSSSPRYLYTLSVQTSRGPTSVRLDFYNGKYKLDAADQKLFHTLPAFNTVLQLVQYYVNNFSQTDYKQVWIDSVSGRPHSLVKFHKPLRKEVGSLKHLARLAVNKISGNKNNVNNNVIRNSLNSLPQSLKEYLELYPYQL